MADGPSQPEKSGNTNVGGFIEEAFKNFAAGIVEAGRRKREQYVDRILSGESLQKTLQGLPRDTIQEILSKVEAVKENLKDPEGTWQRLQDPSHPSSSAERKVFDYACRVLGGMNKAEVTRGLPEVWKRGVDDYIKRIKNLPALEQSKP